jgi:hypothetical protein
MLQQVIQVTLELFRSDTGNAGCVLTDMVILKDHAVVGGQSA